MKAAKFIVLAGGLFGLIAFFLPLASGQIEEGDAKIPISAFQVVKGIDKASDAVSSSDARFSAGLATAEGRAVDSAVGEGLGEKLSEVKTYVLIAFVPTLFLLLFGGLSVKKKSFGRGFGTGALLVGLLGFGVGFLLKTAFAELDAVGAGVYLMILGGLAGLAGGLAGLIKPERAIAA